MKNMFLSALFGAGLLLSAGAFAADTPPAGAIAKCKDGTYFSGTSHKGACKGHQGVQDWLDKDKAAASTRTPSRSSKSAKSGDAAAAAPSSANADTSTSKKSKSKSKKSADTSTASA